MHDKLAQMPRLVHSHKSKPFDINASEVVRWLIDQPEVLNWMFQRLKDTRLIAYEKDSGTWAGVETLQKEQNRS